MSIEAKWVSVAVALAAAVSAAAVRAQRTGSLERARRSWAGLWQKGAASDAVPASLSLYLDLVRWGAAMLVVLYHLKERAFGSAWVVAHLPGNGHAYVTIFFVLSGFVIAATVDRKRSRGPLDYALDRASRLYSVAIPVLLICTLLSLAWPEVDGASAYGFALAHPVATFAANALFVGNAWFLDAAPFVNGPYWSLGYEAMYYVAFGVWTFARGPWRWGLLALVALVAGPKIALLFPCWLCGVWLYRWRNRVPLSAAAAAAVAVLALAIPALLHVAGATQALKAAGALLLGDRYADFSHSVNFLGDYLTAVAFSLHLYAMRWLPFRWPARLAAPIRAGASMSFTLYLFHLPIVIVAMHLLGADRHSNAALAGVVIAVLLLCYLLSRATEENRPALRRWLERVVTRGGVTVAGRQGAGAMRSGAGQLERGGAD
jgi:peptidoglycan/LPS O-acetylase OafA/YrhL